MKGALRTKSPYFETSKVQKMSMKKNYEKFKPLRFSEDNIGIVDEVKYYPLESDKRVNFINLKTSKPVTEHDYKVYDLCAQIPKGYFSTYKAMSDCIGSGSRAVGNALRRNPFAPMPIPCHRVITSDFFVGGYDGNVEAKLFWKKAWLESEGLKFDEKGYIASDSRDKFFTDFDVSNL